MAFSLRFELPCFLVFPSLYTILPNDRNIKQYESELFNETSGCVMRDCNNNHH